MNRGKLLGREGTRVTGSQRGEKQEMYKKVSLGEKKKGGFSQDFEGKKKKKKISENTPQPSHEERGKKPHRKHKEGDNSAKRRRLLVFERKGGKRHA